MTIDKQKLLNAIVKSDLTGKQKLYLEELVNQKSGRWNRNEYHEAHCSICDFTCCSGKITRYCPECGAKMENYGE